MNAICDFERSEPHREAMYAGSHPFCIGHAVDYWNTTAITYNGESCLYYCLFLEWFMHVRSTVQRHRRAAGGVTTPLYPRETALKQGYGGGAYRHSGPLSLFFLHL